MAENYLTSPPLYGKCPPEWRRFGAETLNAILKVAIGTLQNSYPFKIFVLQGVFFFTATVAASRPPMVLISWFVAYN